MSAYRDQALTCPRCGEDIALTQAVSAEVTRHECGRCGGVWVDEDALRRALTQLDFPVDHPFGPLVTTAGTTPCARCRRPMAVEEDVDVCVDHGAWFASRNAFTAALLRIQVNRIERRRTETLENLPWEEAIFVRLWRLFRPLAAEPARRRGKP